MACYLSPWFAVSSSIDLVELDPTRAKWTQIAAELERRIGAGVYPAGTKIPGILALCADFGVAQVTARKALADLRERGLIRTENGIGSFVTDDAN